MGIVTKRPVWLVYGGVLLFFILAGLFEAQYERSRTTPESPWPVRWLSYVETDSPITKHPITALMENATEAFNQLVAKQSKTLPEAVAEYKRRYGRDPPLGFNQWWDFATDNDYVLPDEFDAINEDLAPFWGLSSQELRQRAYQVGLLPSIDLVRIEDGEAYMLDIEKPFKDDEGGARSRAFIHLIERFQHKLPDMDIPINAKAEGRILVPWENVNYPNLTTDGDVTKVLSEFTPDWRGTGNVWESFRRTCPPDSEARRLYSSYRNPHIRKQQPLLGHSRSSDDTAAFADAVPDKIDYCQQTWAHYTQGHFFSDWRTVPVLFPVFSPAKSEGYADIRLPSHYYFRSSKKYTYGWDPVAQRVNEVDDMEVPWEEKSDLIFWRGATTGGGSSPPGHSPTYQRHRFVRMTHENTVANLTIIHASPEKPDEFISTTVPAGDVNMDIMDVGFVRAVGSYPGGETELRKHHRFAESVPLGKHWSYKYLIDLDGMSYSGRFMGFLTSDSAVLKSTIYKEYFDGMIQPWLHYIPISSSYADIYNVHAYFSGPSASTLQAANITVRDPEEWETARRERDAQLQRIAQAGKQWRRTMGRHIDMEVYVYRLCLEYARLWADDRDSMNFELY